ncbi:sugar ABC transporter ATP-binding protein [Paenirhodobacter populi]|uniref:Sugar ABC transporter ATP-binding protein n=1 Tax=Paenirhodobacter populi TaxID=2306993 RepID=A0A443IQR3_9RHOB|nr:sugar ABC transporter ATP-binding protein [Sinirhodobacter populi]RWR09238.1 sugar ABC transporter ATP-binding protein [Sinirhodobacter populi]
MNLEMSGIEKAFGGIAALRGASLQARGGEVHGLMGENGAGKSTLMKILSGTYRRDAGQVLLDGAEAGIDTPHDAIARGISVIYQEFSLAGHLSVAENVLIEELGHPGIRVDLPDMVRRTRALLTGMGFGDIDPMRPAGELPVAYQQVVEICKALSRDSAILVFDEPTAVLTHHETEKLFRLIRDLKARGVCILYISHRLEEIFALCDRVTVLKDGQTVGSWPTAELDEKRLVKLMIGRDLSDLFPPRKAVIGDVLLEVEKLNAGPMVRDVSFSVRAGEVLGVSGLVGAGRTETMRAIFGADRIDSGILRLAGREIRNATPGQAVRNGIGMLPEDRKQQGVLLDLSILVNATMTPANPFVSAFGFLRKGAERAGVERIAASLRLKSAGLDAPAGTLSGGNQQKVALMKWIVAQCRVLIFDEPTRGVDVGAKVEIYRVMNELAEAGAAIIMVSSEMIEVIGMSDRVIVMRRGAIAGELRKEQIGEEAIIHLAMGTEA